MKTPKEKYQNDPKYYRLVNVLLDQLRRCEFTPSEVREAAMLACVINEEITSRLVPTAGGL